MITPPPSDWPRFAPSSDARNIVSSLNAAVEDAARQTVIGSAFHEEFGVVRVLVAGSTSRGTHGGLPVDFDLAVITERTPIPDEAVKDVSDQILKRVVQSRWYIAYCKLLTGFLGSDFEQPEIKLESLGLRGKASFVARYVLKPRDSRFEKNVGFLDVTCGSLPHLHGYEDWIRALFESLGSEAAEHLREEIWLAKAVMKEMGGIYGSKDRGLRGHAVEQLVIQSAAYHSDGLPIGTFHNAMQFIYDQGYIHAGKCDPMPLEDFKRKFPLWRPGGSDREGRPVDLWDLFGDGVREAAEERWRHLLRLSEEYQRVAPGARPWSIAGLALAARSSR